MVAKSRINPIRYFSYLGVAYAVMLILMLLTGLILGLAYRDNPERAMDVAAYFHTLILQPAYFLVNLWWLSRRLHDLAISGWWVLLPLISLLLVMLIVIFALPIPQMLNMALFFLGVGSLLVMTVLSIFPGKLEPNQYGSVPPPNTLFNYIFFVAFIVMFFGYLIWRLLVLFAIRS
jgi:uncharacterized membrane protein YhaH (DUF805 family)